MTSGPGEMMVPLRTDTELPLARVGGKAASLVRLARAGFPVPDGWVVTTAFFEAWTTALGGSPEWQEVCTVAGAAARGDSAELRATCDAVKTRAGGLLFDGRQRRIIEEIAAALGDGLCAVRSSSPEEDLADASFAGLYETVLGANGDTLEDAIRRCFVSCLDVRVAVYKQQKGMPVDIPRIAVVVQHQVASEVAGVAFSLNPLTNDFDEAVVNASWGLGEALVSGEVVPDRWVVDKVSSRTIESHPGTKGNDRPDELSLDAAQLDRVVETVCAIESLYAEPVDVEWAFAGGVLHVLQARPVTTYVPLAPAMQTAPGERRLLYIDPSLADGLTMSGAVSPLTNDLLLVLVELMLRYIAGDVTLERDVKRGVYGVGGARVYVNLSNLLHLIDVRKFAGDRRLIDTTLADIYEHLDVERYRSERPPRYLRKTRLLLAVPGMLWRVRGLLRSLIKAAFQGKAFHEQYRDALARFERDVDLPVDQSMSMSEYVSRLFGHAGAAGMMATAPALMMHIVRGTQVLDRVIDQTSAEQRRLADAIKAGGDDLVFEMGIELYRLSTLLPADAFEDVDTLERSLVARRLPADFLAAWDRFVERFASRGPLEMDLAYPKYGDDPAIALRQMAMLARGGSVNPEEVHERQARERATAYSRLGELLPPAKRRRLARAYRNILDFESARERPKHHITMVNLRIRRRLLAMADRWVDAGRLDRRDDIFELRLDDIDRAERDPGVDLRRHIATTNQFYRDVCSRVRHFPHAIDSRGRILRPPGRQVPGELSGMPVSSGRVRGPVKVMHDPFEKQVEPGDILVAHTTDPGWTPLFINAAAVLLEVGGELQHGALVAREYGKPCIAGVVQVTSRLSDGQMVEVDGDAGVVRILPSPASSETDGQARARGRASPVART